MNKKQTAALERKLALARGAVKRLQQELRDAEARIINEDNNLDVAHAIYLGRHRTFSQELRAMLDHDWEHFSRKAFVEKYKFEHDTRMINCQP